MTNLPNLQPMTDDVLVNRIDEQKARADYEGTNELSFQREQSSRAYTGELSDGLEPTTGMSSVLDNKIQPAVDILTTYLTKIFCSDKETVIFNPTNPQLAPVASQTMMLVNHVLHKTNNGYEVINRWIRDAAVNKNSIVKVIWDDSETSFTETFTDISEEELNAIVAQKEEMGLDVEVIEEEVVEEEVTVGMDPAESEAALMLGEEVIEEYTESRVVSSHYVLRCTHPKGLPRIENLPPEEFLINEGATSIDKDHHLTNFVCHRKLMFVGDVMKMFPDADMEEVYASSGSDHLQYEYETQNRHSFDGTYDYTDDDGQGSMAQVEVTETWIKEDVLGNGTPQWWHVFTVGSNLLMKEEWFDELPFASFCFFPVPHKFYGQSVYGRLRDYYRTSTALLRSEVDMRLQQNTFRIIADPRTIDQRDLQSGRPGIIKASKNFDPKGVMTIPMPTGAGNTLQILEYLDKEIQAQIGIDPVTGAISTDVEKSGNDAEKTAQVVDNSSAKIELFAREFAEMGLRPVIWTIVKMLADHSDDYSVKMITERLTPGMPLLIGEEGVMNLIEKSDLSAKVGLGHMTSTQKMRGIMAIKQEQMALEQTGVMIDPMKKINVSTELARSMGYENVQDFFPSPQEVQQNNAMLQQAIQQAQQQGMQMGMQQAMQQADMQEKMAKVQKIAAEIEKIRADMTIENREVMIKEREQALEELLSQNPNATHTVAALI